MKATATPTVDLGDDELSAMVGATADDQEYEFVNHLCENEVLSGNCHSPRLMKLVANCQILHFRGLDSGTVIENRPTRLPESAEVST